MDKAFYGTSYLMMVLLEIQLQFYQCFLQLGTHYANYLKK